MAKDKYDFIQDLLTNKRLTPTQKERVLLLTKVEIEKDRNLGDHLEERVRKLEDYYQTDTKNSFGIKNIELETSQEFVTHISKPSTSDVKSIIHIPAKNLTKFLKDFNQNPVLKTTCHEIDIEELKNILEFCETEFYDFQIHRSKVQAEYYNEFYENKKYFVDHKIKNMILAYLTGDTKNRKNIGWTDENITFNWNSKDLDIWSSQNPGFVLHPDSGFRNSQNNKEFKLLKPIKTNLLKNRNIQYFAELILHFKYLFHIRSDNSLVSIITHQNLNKNWKNKIKIIIKEKEFPDNIEFFTNVEKLIQTYKAIIELIIEVAEKNGLGKPEVFLTLSQIESGIQLSINHINSVFKKSIQNTIDRDGKTFYNLIKNQINGLCDFYVQADFGVEGCARINLWNDKTKVSAPIENFKGGVEYILIFRK